MTQHTAAKIQYIGTLHDITGLTYSHVSLKVYFRKGAGGFATLFIHTFINSTYLWNLCGICVTRCLSAGTGPHSFHLAAMSFMTMFFQYNKLPNAQAATCM